MNSPFIYCYPPLEAGILLKRYKRFFADIELTSGEIITAHCPNTGPMIGIYQPGNLVQVSKSDNPKRKLPYTWEMIQLDKTWVGTNTSLPNRVIKLALEQQILPELSGRYTQIRPEAPLGEDKKSRMDFLLSSEGDKPPIYLEVKSTTWAQGETVLFPDTVTTRGQKHLEGLMKVLPEAEAVMLYFINRGDCPIFAPGDAADPRYGQLLREAVAKGVEVLPYRFEISPLGVRFLGLAKCQL
ncbi:DNA/RNA nuclease SfsA [Oscillatoria sp. FACHB-1406]|uniref:DNA/RNA nuclease SfsA n=1 Tax=Oscillatoria sp. FACHB-1406 TaxID=2692846 RepID=UPI001685752A|nr:DNA/RNA nuclease SfsA [Oscillatoria sp. FACHB-1406]MBD2577260.1 DNA/RNA nuclease SfsA [Oscillatoria sp. FACHB-1406]